MEHDPLAPPVGRYLSDRFMPNHYDFTVTQLFSREERDFLSLAAQRADETDEGADGFAERVGQIVDTIRTDEIEPAVVHGRFDLLLCWLSHDLAFREWLYENFREGVLGQ